MSDFENSYEAPDLPDYESENPIKDLVQAGGKFKEEIFQQIRLIMEYGLERDPSQAGIYEELMCVWYSQTIEYEMNLIDVLDYVQQYCKDRDKDDYSIAFELKTKSKYSLYTIHVKYKEASAKAAIFVCNDSKELRIFVMKKMPVGLWKILDPSVYIDKEKGTMTYIKPAFYPEEMVDKSLNNTLLLLYAQTKISSMCSIEDLINGVS